MLVSTLSAIAVMLGIAAGYCFGRAHAAYLAGKETPCDTSSS